MPRGSDVDPEPDPSSAPGLLLDLLFARAAGVWRVESDRLVQVGFSSAATLDPEVARRFAEATLSVPLDRIELGIVGAVARGEVEVSIADQLPPDAGSGYWLRAFGALRSVAVPLRHPDGTVRAVAAVALASMEPPAERVADMIRGAVGPARRID